MQNTADAKIIWHLVLNVAGATQRNDGHESSGQFFEPQAISSSLDGQTVARRLARSGRWSSALITLCVRFSPPIRFLPLNPDW